MVEMTLGKVSSGWLRVEWLLDLRVRSVCSHEGYRIYKRQIKAKARDIIHFIGSLLMLYDRSNACLKNPQLSFTPTKCNISVTNTTIPIYA